MGDIIPAAPPRRAYRAAAGFYHSLQDFPSTCSLELQVWNTHPHVVPIFRPASARIRYPILRAPMPRFHPRMTILRDSCSTFGAACDAAKPQSFMKLERHGGFISIVNQLANFLVLAVEYSVFVQE